VSCGWPMLVHFRVVSHDLATGTALVVDQPTLWRTLLAYLCSQARWPHPWAAHEHAGQDNLLANNHHQSALQNPRTRAGTLA